MTRLRLGWTDRYIERRNDCAVVVVDLALWATPAELDRVVAEIREAKGWASERDAAAGQVEAVEVKLRPIIAGPGWTAAAFRAGMLTAARMVRGGA